MPDFVGRRIDAFPGAAGRATLRALIPKRVAPEASDQRPVDGQSGRGELQANRIPDAQGIGDSFKVVAGARCEVQQTVRPQEIEVIPLAFTGQGRTMVLVGAAIVAG